MLDIFDLYPEQVELMESVDCDRLLSEKDKESFFEIGQGCWSKVWGSNRFPKFVIKTPSWRPYGLQSLLSIDIGYEFFRQLVGEEELVPTSPILCHPNFGYCVVQERVKVGKWNNVGYTSSLKKLRAKVEERLRTCGSLWYQGSETLPSDDLVRILYNDLTPHNVDAKTRILDSQCLAFCSDDLRRVAYLQKLGTTLEDLFADRTFAFDPELIEAIG